MIQYSFTLSLVQVKELFQDGVDPDCADEWGNSVLLVAAQNGLKNMVSDVLRLRLNGNMLL